MVFGVYRILLFLMNALKSQYKVKFWEKNLIEKFFCRTFKGTPPNPHQIFPFFGEKVLCYLNWLIYFVPKRHGAFHPSQYEKAARTELCGAGTSWYTVELPCWEVVECFYWSCVYLQ
jgi:hypothetical protein